MRTVLVAAGRAAVTRLADFVGAPSRARTRAFLKKYLAAAEGDILDLGCGASPDSDLLPPGHFGVDVDIRALRRPFGGRRVAAMSAERLAFPDDTFDHVVATAMTHHLSDLQLSQMLLEVIRVLRPHGSLHVIDAILPLQPNPFKWVWFKADRGKHARRKDALLGIVRRLDPSAFYDLQPGPVHDLIYIRLKKAT